ncbi:MAG: helix-turn-helix domain-containing protein [Alphaproteobacteria bacterium]|nr:helix-turn-helix domain-containing protein [Alphaproteobacteria bacterium]
MLSIGDLSRRTGVKIPTIRYYEQMGLIAAPERTEGNQRRYTSTELQRLSFIKHARDLGLNINAIRDLAELSADPDKPCADVHSIANDHLTGIREKILRLLRLEKELQRIVRGCDTDQVGDCRVIEALCDHALCAQDH